MLLALQDLGRAGKVEFVGFDSSQVFLDAMKRKARWTASCCRTRSRWAIAR